MTALRLALHPRLLGRVFRTLPRRREPPPLDLVDGLPVLCTVEQAAVYASVSEKTVRRWIDRAWIDGYRAVRSGSSRVRIDRTSLLSFVREQRLRTG